MKPSESKNEAIWALGLMSGTSLDGVDAALILTDGVRVFAHGESLTLPYSDTERAQLFACLEGKGDIAQAVHMLTLRHIDAVEALLAKSTIPRAEVKLIGFHGQTIYHAPERGITQQIGNPALLVARTGIPTIADFRSADVAAGGQGAPLVPLYHAALVNSISSPLEGERKPASENAAGFVGGESHHITELSFAKAQNNRNYPIVIVNIGGVSNITYIDGEEIIACDTGAGNALMDDWVHRHTGAHYDKDGMLAAGGTVRADIVAQLLAHPFFNAPPPKSLDRNAFAKWIAPLIEPMSLGEGAATLCEFTAASIAAILLHLPRAPKQWVIAGGGRHNPTLLHMLNKHLANICVAESVGLNGDSLEAEAFAFLAVRSLNNMPLSLPSTTGVREPTLGGVYYGV